MSFFVVLVKFLFVIFIALISGRGVLRLLGSDFCHFEEEIVFSYAIGMAVVSYTVLAAGLLGLLYEGVIYVSFFVYAVIFRAEIVPFSKEMASALKRWNFKKYRPVTMFLILLFLVAVSINIIGALTPTVGTDAQAYHASCPRLFVQNHKISFMPYNDNSVWPLFVEMFYVIGLLSKSLFLGKLFNITLGLTAAGAVYAFCERFFNSRTGILAAAIFYLTPLVNTESVYANSDFGLILYIFLSVYAFIVWSFNKKRAWIFLCGLTAGIGAAAKYIGLVPLAIISVFVLCHSMTISDRREALRALFVYICGVLIVALPWYARIYLLTGNPVYPAFPELFGGIGIPMAAVVRHTTGTGLGIYSFITAPWNLTVRPELFGEGAEQFGIMFLSFMPAALILVNKNRIIRRLFLFSLLFYTQWFFLIQLLRFLAIVLPLLSIAVAGGITAYFCNKKFTSKTVWIFIFVVLTFNLSLNFYYASKLMPSALGAESRSRYLARTEPVYSIALWANKNLGPDSKILLANESSIYYFDVPVINEYPFRYTTRYPYKVTNDKELIAFLRKKKITHIIYCSCKEPVVYDETMTIAERLKDASFTRRYLKQLKTEAFGEKGNTLKRTYVLYKIKEES